MRRQNVYSGLVILFLLREEFIQKIFNQKYFFLRCVDSEESKYTISGQFDKFYLSIDNRIKKNKLEIDFHKDPADMDNQKRRG
jgi:hypothetical protein